MPFARFTLKAQEAIERAQQLALEKSQGEFRGVHLLYSLITQEDTLVIPLLEKLNINIDDWVQKLESLIERQAKVFTPLNTSFGQFYLTQEMVQILEEATKIANQFKDAYISCEHLFLALASTNNSSRDLFREANLEPQKIKEAILELRQGSQVTEETGDEKKYKILEKYTQDLTQQARENKLDPVIGREAELRRVMEVLSRRTKNNPVLIGEPGVGKTAIVEGLAQRIVSNEVPESLKNKRIVSLDLGAVIAGTKFRGEFEERLKAVLKEIKNNPDIIVFIDEVHNLVGAGAAEGAIDASNLLKPALARGELRAIGATTFKDYREYIEKDPALERRFQPVVVEEPSIEDAINILRGLKHKYEIHHGVKISDEAIVAAVNLSVRYITERFLPDKAIDLIDEAASALRIAIDSKPLEIEELERKVRSLEMEKALLKKDQSRSANLRLKKIESELKDLNKNLSDLIKQWQNERQLISQIQSLKKELEQKQEEKKKAEREGNLEKMAELIYGEIPQMEKNLLALEKKVKSAKSKLRFIKEEIEAEDIARVVSRWTGIPVTKLLESESEKLKKMEEILARRVVGQKEAIEAVSRALRRARAGIGEVDRPFGSFMFLGPTGVGKTELARALAEFMFNDEKALIRIDMSEYMERHTVSRLIGSPPGYVGYEEGGQLTEAIRHRPYSLILFDEIEKAHSEVFNILLQVLDNGRLTDGRGRIVNFKNTIIIMTSNIGGNYFSEMANLGFSASRTSTYEERKNKLKERIENALKEKFRPEFINRIDEIIIFNPLTAADIEQIVEIQINQLKNRLKEKNIYLEISAAAKKYLAREGYNPDFGARPLKRLIQRTILDPLSERIIANKIKSGSRVKIDVKNNKIYLQP